MLTVHAFDRQRDLPLTYQYDFGEAIRKHLVLPRPLGADAYEASTDTSVARTAHLTLWGTYAATIGSDGRITESSATGGAHNDGFDTAMLTAMMALDSTDQLSMVAAGLPSESVRLRVEIAARDSGAKRGIGFLRYPSSLLQTGMSDQVQAAFVVDTDGHAEPGSIQLVSATRREFAQSVLDAMPRFRYKPLEVSGCAVRSIAEESFQFYVRK